VGLDLSALEVSGSDNPNKQGSVTRWNNLVAQLERGLPVTPQDFGAVGDGSTDDGAAFADAIAFLKAQAANDSGIYKGSNRLRIPSGHYYLGTTTLDITHTLIIEGEGTGQAGGTATKLRWAENTTGIRVQRYNTSGAGAVDSPTHYGGDATTIRGLHLRGAFTTAASEGDYHAIHMKARALVQDCFIERWQGSGIYIVAIGGGGAPDEGNANCFAVERCAIYYCQNGVYIAGADVNAGYTTGLDVSENRQWGIIDNSFLGNTHIAPHAANNGFADSGLSAAPYLPPTLVSDSGNRYYVIAGQEAGASTNAPSGAATDNTWWGYLSPGTTLGASIPAWSSGATYRAGGAYRTVNVNAVCVFVNAYAEGGQAPPQFDAGQTLCSGGIWGTGLGQSGGTLLTGRKSQIAVGKDLGVGRNFSVSGSVTLGPTSVTAADGSITIANTSAGSFVYFQTYDTAGALVTDDGYIYGEGNIGLVLNGKSTTNAIRLRANGSNIATVKSTGIDLAAGKTLLVGGTQVIGAQGAAIADATDAPSAITQLNLALAALRTHGLIAT
jgi:hypothetical protein